MSPKNRFDDIFYSLVSDRIFCYVLSIDNMMKNFAMGQLLPTFITILTVGILTNSTVTIAKQTHISQNLNCKNPQAQQEMNRCAGLSYQNADKKLNQVYQQVMPKLEKSRKQKLITAQKAWINFRDTNCEFEKSSFQGGSMAPLIYAGCLERLTQQRTQQLQNYLKGDL